MAMEAATTVPELTALTMVRHTEQKPAVQNIVPYTEPHIKMVPDIIISPDTMNTCKKSGAWFFRKHRIFDYL